ncbi:MAG: IS481 family transposase [Planctomycetota bacterium]
MPWKESDVVNERLNFIAAHQRGGESMTELCARFGISRKTGYKLVRRYEKEGGKGLHDRSRAPHSHPQKVSEESVTAELEVRRNHPTWGSKKIHAVLEREGELEKIPARSTIDRILKAAGLVVPRKHRRHHCGGPRVAPVVPADRPNQAWSMDYKGWFRVGDGTRCDPFTANDMCSRASLSCTALVEPKLEDVKRCLERAFREYGLPEVILSDNGPPFGAQGLGGLSRLGVWLLKLDVQPVFIQPGHPEQNGRHERFHETLKAETAAPPKRSIRAQQRAFNEFTRCYNEERPHEALEMKAPFDVYAASERRLPRTEPAFEYDQDVTVRRVRADGAIKVNSRLVFVGSAFAGENVGIRQIDDRVQHVYAGRMRLGLIFDGLPKVVPIAEDLDAT